MNKNKSLKKKFEKFLDMTWEGSHGRYEAEEAYEDMNYIPWTDSGRRENVSLGMAWRSSRRG